MATPKRGKERFDRMQLPPSVTEQEEQPASAAAPAPAVSGPAISPKTAKKEPVTYNMDPKTKKALRLLAIEQDTDMTKLLDEAVQLLFAEHGWGAAKGKGRA